MPKEFIIEDSSKLEYTGKRRFLLSTLAYVTPVRENVEKRFDSTLFFQWNSSGYDIAKWLAPKFDIVVPVWFQVLPPSQAAPEEGCRIAGLHDIDQGAFRAATLLKSTLAGWIRDVRANNSDVKIVPRFNVEQHAPNDLQMLLGDARMQEKCIWNIIHLLQVRTEQKTGSESGRNVREIASTALLLSCGCR